jgi:hypothetical protein
MNNVQITEVDHLLPNIMESLTEIGVLDIHEKTLVKAAKLLE